MFLWLGKLTVVRNNSLDETRYHFVLYPLSLLLIPLFIDTMLEQASKKDGGARAAGEAG